MRGVMHMGDWLYVAACLLAIVGLCLASFSERPTPEQRSVEAHARTMRTAAPTGVQAIQGEKP